MVDEQIRARGVRDPRVLAAMEELPREIFVPQAGTDEAFSDRRWPSTASRPFRSLSWSPR